MPSRAKRCVAPRETSLTYSLDLGKEELVACEAPAGREPDKPLPLTSEVADTSQSVNEERGLSQEYRPNS